VSTSPDARANHEVVNKKFLFDEENGSCEHHKATICSRGKNLFECQKRGTATSQNAKNRGNVAAKTVKIAALSRQIS
jgi:hypothetical protein